eukprot:scaffold33672_cov70-Phaeocystis_antarctica.AAC.5
MPTQKKSKEKKPKKAKDEDSDDYSGGRLPARPPAPHSASLPGTSLIGARAGSRRRREGGGGGDGGRPQGLRQPRAAAPLPGAAGDGAGAAALHGEASAGDPGAAAHPNPDPDPTLSLSLSLTSAAGRQPRKADPAAAGNHGRRALVVDLAHRGPQPEARHVPQRHRAGAAHAERVLQDALAQDGDRPREDVGQGLRQGVQAAGARGRGRRDAAQHRGDAHAQRAAARLVRARSGRAARTAGRWDGVPRRRRLPDHSAGHAQPRHGAPARPVRDWCCRRPRACPARPGQQEAGGPEEETAVRPLKPLRC